MRPARIIETPEQKSARILEQNRQRQIRYKRKLALEKPEQAAARRIIESQKQSIRNKKRRQLESPEVAAAQRAKYVEARRKRIEAERARETLEERAARCQKQKDDVRRRLEKKLSMEMPEQTEARCARLAMERAAKDMETPEQVAARRAIEKERKRQSTTPEQAAARRARDAETRKKRIQAQRSTETPEGRAARLRKQNEQFKRRREKMVQEQAAAREERSKIQEKEMQQYKDRRAKQQPSKHTKRRKRHRNENPEERVARLRRHNENIKRYREKKQAVETTEETAARKANTTQLQTLRRDLETSKKRAARLQTARENRKKYLAKRKEERQAMTAKNSAAVTHGEFNESKMWSSFATSESSFSVTTTTIGERFSISTIDEPVDQYPKGNILIKNEPSPDSWSYCEASESSFVPKELFQDREFELSKNGYEYSESEYKVTASNDVKVERDEHFMYGAYIADRFRKCKRNDTEVNFAKNHIESILLDLSAGAFCCISSVSKNEIDQADQAPSLLTSDISRPFVQDIIVKEEVHM